MDALRFFKGTNHNKSQRLCLCGKNGCQNCHGKRFVTLADICQKRPQEQWEANVPTVLSTGGTPIAREEDSQLPRELDGHVEENVGFAITTDDTVYLGQSEPIFELQEGDRMDADMVIDWSQWYKHHPLPEVVTEEEEQDDVSMYEQVIGLAQIDEAKEITAVKGTGKKINIGK